VSCPHTHQQNGYAERKHSHLVETGLALLAHSSVLLHLGGGGGDAFLTACFLINRLPSRVINFSTPLQKLTGAKPDFSMIKTFGAACWPNLRPYNAHKLNFRTKQFVFIGYNELHKGYKCLHIPTSCVYISRDVVFDETIFPFSNLPEHTSSTSPIDVSALLIPSPTSLASHCDNVTMPGPVSTNLSIDIPDGSMSVASGEHSDQMPPADGHNPDQRSVADDHYPEQVYDVHPTLTLPPQVPSKQGVRTRLQNNIRKPKQRTNGTIAYLANAENLEPTDYRVAM
jgi:hypothetical protein